MSCFSLNAQFDKQPTDLLDSFVCVVNDLYHKTCQLDNIHVITYYTGCVVNSHPPPLLTLGKISVFECKIHCVCMMLGSEQLIMYPCL